MIAKILFVCQKPLGLASPELTFQYHKGKMKGKSEEPTCLTLPEVDFHHGLDGSINKLTS